MHVSVVLQDIDAASSTACRVSRRAGRPPPTSTAATRTSPWDTRCGGDGRYDEADAHFEEAHGLFAGLSLEILTRECTAARAWVLAYRGEHSRAVAMLEPVLDHLDREGMIGACLPATMLRGCVEVLRLADDPRASGVLEVARRYLHETAAEIGDPDLEAGYLSIPPNVALLEGDGPVPAPPG